MSDTAETHLQAGRVAEAIETFRGLLGTDPDNAVLRGRVAEAYWRAGNVERAFHHFQKAASLFIRFNDLPSAVRMLDLANRVSPNEPDILFRWAECLESLGQDRGLRPILGQLVQVARAQGDRRRLWALDRLVNLEPHNLELAVTRAAALAESGRLSEAVQSWRRLSPNLPRSHQDWPELIALTARYAKARPDCGAVLAQVLLTHQRAREALALLVPFYDEYPDHVEVLEAVVQALEMMEAGERVIFARLELLRIQTDRRLRPAALDGVAQLLRRYPTEPDVLRQCAETCKVFGLTSESSRLQYQLCQLHDRRNEPDTRDRVLAELLRDSPNHQGGLELAIAILAAAGRHNEAEALSQRLVKTGEGPVSTNGEAFDPDITMPPRANGIQTKTATIATMAEMATTLGNTQSASDTTAPENGRSESLWSDPSAVQLVDEDVIFSEPDNTVSADNTSSTDEPSNIRSTSNVWNPEEPTSRPDDHAAFEERTAVGTRARGRAPTEAASSASAASIPSGQWQDEPPTRIDRDLLPGGPAANHNAPQHHDRSVALRKRHD